MILTLRMQHNQYSILYFSDEPDVIGPEGIQKLCKDLHLDPEDVSCSGPLFSIAFLRE